MFEFRDSKIWQLTPKQKEAWENLEKAFKECAKQKIYIANNYGELLAFRKEYVQCYTDVHHDTNDEHIKNPSYAKDDINKIVIIRKPRGIPYFHPKDDISGMADDLHGVILTDKGLEIFLKEQEE